jgi:uncharacterized protein Yka (UPF0111/DUF47 family)
MKEINISIEALEKEIDSLRRLQSSSIVFRLGPQNLVSGGKTVGELEKIADMYKTLNDDFTTLISNTIAFMENVKNSYMSNDANAASAISK